MCRHFFFWLYSGKKLQCFQVTYLVNLKSVSTAVFPHFVFNYAPTFTTPAKCENFVTTQRSGGVRSRLFGQEIIMSCLFVGFFFFPSPYSAIAFLFVWFFFPPHRRMLLIKICNRPLSNWSLGSGQVSTPNNALAIASFNHKPNMKRSARLRFLSFLPVVVCARACSSPAKRKLIYQAAIYQAANQPDNLQLCLLPGWATLHSSPRAGVKPQPSAPLSYFSLSQLCSKSLNNLKDF